MTGAAGGRHGRVDAAAAARRAARQPVGDVPPRGGRGRGRGRGGGGQCDRLAQRHGHGLQQRHGLAVQLTDGQRLGECDGHRLQQRHGHGIQLKKLPDVGEDRHKQYNGRPR